MVQHQGSRCLNLPRVFSSFKRVLNDKDLACWNGNKPHCFLRGKAPMEDAALIESSEGVFEGNKECESGRSHKTFADLMKEKGVDSSSSSEITEELDGQSQVSAEDSYSSASMGWQVQEISASNCTTPLASEYAEKKDLGKENSQDQDSVLSVPVQELDMITNRLSKLLLGEDMSGSGNGVPTAMVISNAITNLCATMFGQLWKLEPLSAEKKTMWRREMELLLCVSDHIVELKPTWQTFPDGTKIEIMTSRPRSDLYVNLPALRKLDSMLLEILDSFVSPEFRYVDQGVLPTDRVGSSFRQALQRLEEKWWLPVPQVPPCGLSEDARKQLQHRRDCTNQILKAAMAINANALAETDIPQSYLESLPKTARANLGDVIYRYITSDDFSPAYLLACLDLSSEYQAMEIANRVEASICIWNKKTSSKPVQGRTTRSSSRSSWEVIMDRIVEGDKIETLAERAETLLLSLKQRFPGLPQTALDTSKIQYNKDVGKSILESYSRVLESLASNILARIDDVLYVDDLNKHSDEFSSLSNIGVIAHKSISVPFSMPGQHSPYRSSFGTPNFSPEQGVSPANGANSPFMNTSNNLPQRGAGVIKVLTEFGSSIDRKKKSHRLSPMEKFVPTLKTFDEVPPALETDSESSDTEEDVKLRVLEQAWLE